MRTLSKHLFAALLGTAIISSCSRPVAYFQPTAREHFKAATTETVAAVTPDQPAEVVSVTSESSNLVATVTPTEQLAQTKQAVGQLEAYVRNDNKLASNKKLANRMERLNAALESASAKTAATTTATATSAKKMTFAERMVLKKMDKKIKNHVAPDEAKAMNSNVRLGLIIGLIGLVLWLLGGGTILGVLGLIGFVVGIVLILLGVINQ